MKTKTPVSTKKQPVTVKDLKARKNPKGGGGLITVTPINDAPTIFIRGAQPIIVR